MCHDSTISPQYGFLSEGEKKFPAMIVVQVTNVCNLECIHCPHSFISKGENYFPKHMNMELYKKIVDEVALSGGTIFRILCDGEPLCHPQFLDMMCYAKDKNIEPINFITNGLLLDESMAKALLDIGIETVEISLDAFHKSTYERIRKGSNYELVMHNVHTFISLRNQHKAKTKIFVSIIDQKESEKEYRMFIDYWTPKVDKVITRTYTSIGGLVNRSKMKIDTKGERWPCPQLWRRLFITVDGYAEYCVEDWYDKSVVGDVNKESIKNIWQSEEYNKIRECHLARRFDLVPYCAQCPDWKAREWRYDYFHALAEVLNKDDGITCVKNEYE